MKLEIILEKKYEDDNSIQRYRYQDIDIIREVLKEKFGNIYLNMDISYSGTAGKMGHRASKHQISYIVTNHKKGIVANLIIKGSEAFRKDRLEVILSHNEDPEALKFRDKLRNELSEHFSDLNQPYVYL